MSSFFLIADSGSTKTSWALVDSKDHVVRRWTGSGLNPYFLSTGQIEDIIRKEVLGELGDFFPEKVFFYGAGCSHPVLKEKVRNALENQIYLSSAEVEHDMLGAARSLFNNQPGMACILGTGSNACLYDGHTISFQLPSFGYLWGDYGSGSYLGRQWCHAYFYKTMPENIRMAFESKGFDTEYILGQTYGSSTPNRFLASMAPLIREEMKDPWVMRFVERCLEDFIILLEQQIPEAKRWNPGFCGSVAEHFSEILRSLLEKHDFSNPKICADPLPGLIAFHGNKQT